jgi:hypothetical protein
MKRLILGAMLAAVLSTATVAQAGVTIVYPFDGEDYPVGPSNPTQDAYYQSFSFSAVCPGGQNTVKWSIDGNGLGATDFYDQVTVQQVQKVDIGWHVFEVDAGCGSAGVKFHVKEQ